MIDQAFPSDGELPDNGSFSMSNVLIDLSTTLLKGSSKLVPNGMNVTMQTTRRITNIINGKGSTASFPLWLLFRCDGVGASAGEVGGGSIGGCTVSMTDGLTVTRGCTRVVNYTGWCPRKR